MFNAPMPMPYRFRPDTDTKPCSFSFCRQRLASSALCGNTSTPIKRPWWWMANPPVVALPQNGSNTRPLPCLPCGQSPGLPNYARRKPAA